MTLYKALTCSSKIIKTLLSANTKLAVSTTVFSVECLKKFEFVFSFYWPANQYVKHISVCTLHTAFRFLVDQLRIFLVKEFELNVKMNVTRN